MSRAMTTESANAVSRSRRDVGRAGIGTKVPTGVVQNFAVQRSTAPDPSDWSRRLERARPTERGGTRHQVVEPVAAELGGFVVGRADAVVGHRHHHLLVDDLDHDRCLRGTRVAGDVAERLAHRCHHLGAHLVGQQRLHRTLDPQRRREPEHTAGLGDDVGELLSERTRRPPGPSVNTIVRTSEMIRSTSSTTASSLLGGRRIGRRRDRLRREAHAVQVLEHDVVQVASDPLAFGRPAPAARWRP